MSLKINNVKSKVIAVVITMLTMFWGVTLCTCSTSANIFGRTTCYSRWYHFPKDHKLNIQYFVTIIQFRNSNKVDVGA